VALVRCDFFSDVLGLGTSMTVILPQRTSTRVGVTGATRDTPPPTLYLLHGLSDDDTIWLRHTSIERYVAPLGLAVVMPQAHRSFYADEHQGSRYWTFLSAELPELVGSFFRLSDRREDTYVAGLSMGGYGALKWALRQPGRFAAAASLSGALDLARIQRETTDPDDPRQLRRVFGPDPIAGTDNDLLSLLDQIDPATTPVPRLYVCCGTDDPLYGDSLTFENACRGKGIGVTARYEPAGHEWGYWDAKIRDVLDWLEPSLPSGTSPERA
jgi:putative tributyrin esterase